MDLLSFCADDFGIHFEIDTAGFTYTKKRKEALYHCQMVTAFLLKFLLKHPMIRIAICRFGKTITKNLKKANHSKGWDAKSLA